MNTITRRRLLANAVGAGAIMVPLAARAVSIVDPGVATTAVDGTPHLPPDRPAYIARAMLIGESLPQMMDYTHEGFAFSKALIDGAGASTVSSVEIIPGAAGGSVSCLENKPSVGSNYWVNYNGGAPTDGPLLTAVVTEIARRIATLQGRPPTCFLYEMGFNEVTGMAGNEGALSAAQALVQHNVAVSYLFSRLQASLLPFWGPIPIFVVPLGRALGGGGADEAGYDAIRRAQLTTILSLPNVARVADIYDMGVEGDVHPARNWHAAYAQRQAKAVLATQYGLTPLYTGPTIASVSQPNSVTVEVHVAAEANDTVTLPTSAFGPCGFAFYDGTTRLGATFAGWNGNNPKWTLSTAPGALKMSFPNGAMADFDPQRLILGTTSRLPLASRYI